MTSSAFYRVTTTVGDEIVPAGVAALNPNGATIERPYINIYAYALEPYLQGTIVGDRFEAINQDVGDIEQNADGSWSLIG